MASTPDDQNPLRLALVACRSGFITAGVFSFIVNLLILTMPLYMFSVFDRVLGSGNLSTLTMLALIAGASLMVQALVDVARTYLFVQMSGFIDRRIGARLLEISIKTAVPRGQPKTTELLRKLSGLRAFLSGQQVYLLMDAPWIPIFMLILFMLNFWIGLVATIIGVTLFVLALINRMLVDPALARATRSATRAHFEATAAVASADAIESMGMRPHLLARWNTHNLRAIEIQAIASRRAGIIQSIIKMLRMGSLMAVMTVAAVQIVDPTAGLSRGAMIASVLLVSRALMPIEAIVSGWNSVIAALASYHEVKQALADDATIVEETVTPARPRGDLRVENLVFHPDGVQRPILNRISFQLKAGESLGIVGPSASGKSTLARMMVGLEAPTTGHVRLDGVDLTQWPTADRGMHIGYLPQEVSLLTGTVKENISRFEPNPSAQAIMDASRMANIHPMIQHFPNGYETNIGTNGNLLSGGQRQRVGLARALYGKVRLVVLDEPNANLDVRGEQALTEAINTLKMRGVTVVVILHRPNILQSVDYVMVMRDGMIQKFAPRDEMLPVIGAAPQPRKVAAEQPKVLPRQTG